MDCGYHRPHEKKRDASPIQAPEQLLVCKERLPAAAAGASCRIAYSSG